MDLVTSTSISDSSRYKWTILPDELKLLILSKLDPQSLFAFANTSRVAEELVQDDFLCAQMCKAYYPLAAARRLQEIALQSQSNVPDRTPDKWFQFLQGTTQYKECVIRRRSIDYYELSTSIELPPRYSQNLGLTPRGRHHSKYNFGHLLLFFTGVDVFLVINLTTRNPVEFALPAPFKIRDICLVKDHVCVLTTRSTGQCIFLYDLAGTLVETVVTQRTDLVLLLANCKFFLAYTAEAQTWVVYTASASVNPVADQQPCIPGSSSTVSTTSAVDEQYFYQLHEATGVLMIYDLQYQYCVSKIALFHKHQHIRIEVQSVNGHAYVYGPGHVSLIVGLEMTKVNVSGIPNDDDDSPGNFSC